ncbi:dTDP-4-dehydrorhamnose reductase [Flavobacteriales bacterium 33_180_T64]|nr:dTDP-4-dehydrorhamnose reductase [Flavobacteriales bacterium 33_180_T64]
MRVLVTGANGQLGKTIREISYDFLGLIEFVFVEKSKLDITKKESVKHFFETNNFDYCINCAAYTNVDLAESETKVAMDVNANAVKHLAVNCKQNNVVLIHISTDYVFDGKNTNPYLENDQTNPINVYGESKLLGEEYIKANLNNHFIIRTSWLYSKFNKNFVKTIFEKIKNNQSLKIITSQKSTPTSCLDLSEFIMFLITNKVKSFGTYHFSAQGEATWYDLGLQIAKHFDNSSNIKPIEMYESIANRPLYSVLSNDKAIALTNKKPPSWKVSVNQILCDLSQ